MMHGGPWVVVKPPNFEPGALVIDSYRLCLGQAGHVCCVEEFPPEQQCLFLAPGHAEVLAWPEVERHKAGIAQDVASHPLRQRVGCGRTAMPLSDRRMDWVPCCPRCKLSRGKWDGLTHRCSGHSSLSSAAKGASTGSSEFHQKIVVNCWLPMKASAHRRMSEAKVRPRPTGMS